MNPKLPHVLEGIGDLGQDTVRELLSISKNYQQTSPTLPQSHTLNEFSGLTLTTLFLEPSTRTKFSFLQAAHNLGMRTLDFDPERSSLLKAESFKDTLDTLVAQGVSFLVTRTTENNFLQPFKDKSPIPIINGGDGHHQHPTQALTDLLTFVQLGVDPAQNYFCLIGDCPHSRVANSLVDLMALWGGKIKAFYPAGMIWEKGEAADHVEIHHQLDFKLLNESSFIYLLRVQNERIDQNEKQLFANYHEQFGLNSEKYKKLTNRPMIFHPGPANPGVEIDLPLMNSEHYKGKDQVYYSVFMRMALLKLMIITHFKLKG